MDESNRELSPRDEAENVITGIGYQLRKGIDRVGFEADKMMRVNRVRSEAGRLHKQVDRLMSAVSERVLELDAEGAEMEATIKDLVRQVRGIRRQLADKASEIEAINTEQWVEPPPPVVQTALPPAKPQVQALPSGSSKQIIEQPKEHPTVCPNCHGPLRPISAFCPNCGYKL